MELRERPMNFCEFLRISMHCIQRRLFLAGGIAALSFLVAFAAYGWTNPTAAPPNGNPNPPLQLQSSTPGTQQTGHMNISGTGLFGGNVGIGTTGPVEKLTIGDAGNIALFPVADDGSVQINVRSSAGRTNSIGYLNFQQKGIWGTYVKLWVGRQWGGSGTQNAFIAGVIDDPTGYPNQNTHLTINIPDANGINPNAVVYIGTGSSATNTRTSLYTENGAVFAASRGNVGIGTTGPSEKLTIAGNIGFTTGSLLDSQTTLGSGQNDLIISAPDYLQLKGGYQTHIYAGGNERVRIDHNGNVGIGTTNPGAKLQISGGYLTIGGPRNTDLKIAAGGSSPDAAQIYWGDNTGWKLHFGTFDAANNFQPRVTFVDTGNVGIGTKGPGYKLHVIGDIYANGGWLRTSGGAGWYSESYGGGWYMSDSSWIRTYNEKAVWTGGGLLGSNGGLTIGYGGASPPGGGAIIAGNVGIGTTNPLRKLEVNNAMRFTNSSADTNDGVIGTAPFAAGLNIVGINTDGGGRKISYLGSLIQQENPVGNTFIGNTYFPGSGVWNSAGDLIVGGGSGKINAGTVDPIYNIGGIKYATYLPGMTGVKEETTGIVRLARISSRGDGNLLSAEIDFGKVATGSDLWLFYQITDFGANWEHLAVLLTPNFDGEVWYAKDPPAKTLTIYAKPHAITAELSHYEVSYRLTAPRFDHEKWPNTSSDSIEGMIVPPKE